MQINYDNIPHEMRQYAQWCCWKYEDRGGQKPTKVPYNPVTNHMASVTDANTWCSYEYAVANASRFDGIGFILSDNDPYTFIDLDDTEGNNDHTVRQIKIYETFDSYSERSPSGKGLHIIVKARVPNGRRRAHVEIYSTQRYMTMTGDVFTDKPIADRSELAHRLWEEMGGIADQSINGGGINTPEREDDNAVLVKAANAANGQKFVDLYNGAWQAHYPSQSEADLSLVNMVAFYTQNRDQIVRIFHASALGKREKAKRPMYLEYMLRKCFDNILPPIDFDATVPETAPAPIPMPSIPAGVPPLPEIAMIKGTNPTATEHPSEAFDKPMKDLRDLWEPKPFAPPRGIVGEMARFIYQAAPRPVAEMAVCAALGLMAGIAGRAYNVSDTGLNLYLLLLAPTGTGKEGMSGGIEKLLNRISMQVPAATSFRGPSEIASGQALLKHLSNNNPCFVSIVGEFGLKMRQLADPRASSSEIMLKRVLLDLYNKSGAHARLGASVYAQKENNSEAVKSPAFSLLGESTPETFYSALDESLITDGLLPRVTVMEYQGDRPPLNEGHGRVVPEENLVSNLAELCTYSLTLQSTEKVVEVRQSPEAAAFFRELDKRIDAVINNTKTDVLRHLWNRAHIKALKMAAVIAVGVNYTHPVIQLEDAQWAYNIIANDVLNMVARFGRGEIGTGKGMEDKQGGICLNFCIDYLRRELTIESDGIRGAKEMHAKGIVPYSIMSRRLISVKAFKEDKLGGTNSLKRTIQLLLDSGELQEVPKQQLQEMGIGGRGFILPNRRRQTMQPPV